MSLVADFERPLLSLPGALAFSRTLGGIPLDLDFWHPTSFKIRVQPARSTLLLLTLVGAYSVALYWAAAEFGSPFAFKQVSKALDIAFEDALLSLVVFFLGLVSTVLYFVLFIVKKDEIGRFYADSYSFKNSMGSCPLTKELRMKGGVFWWFVLRLMVGLLAGSCYSYNVYMILCNLRGERGEMTFLDWCFTVSFGASISLTSLDNMLIGSGIMVCLDTTTMMTDILEKWRSNVEESIATKDKDYGMRRHLEFGRAFCRLAERSAKLASPFVVVTYVYFLIGGVLYTYGALAVLCDPVHTSKVIAAGNGVIAAAFYVSILSLSMTGNALTRKKCQVVTSLDRLALARYRTLDEEAKFELKMLEKDLDDVVRLRPYDFFEVCNSNFLGLAATHATYIIVALQFRAS